MASVEKQKTMRELLKEFAELGLNLVTGDRDVSYGPPQHNLKVQEDLNRVVYASEARRRELGKPDLPDGVLGGISCIQLKIARIMMGPEITDDTVLDLLGYVLVIKRCKLEHDAEEALKAGLNKSP